jgi:septal ring factor EnvC (AmiA/AmiB activator)
MPNRLLCTVFDEMRQCVKTSNFSYLLGLIEESQSLANRMESHLYEMKDYERLHKEIRDLKTKRKKLEKEVGELEAQKPD